MTRIPGYVNEILQALEKTRKLAKQMGRWQARKYQSVTGDLTGIVQDYLAGVTLYDIVEFCHIEKALRKCRKETLQLYEFVGDVDTDIAIASFQKSLTNWSSPMRQIRVHKAGENLSSAYGRWCCKQHRIAKRRYFYRSERIRQIYLYESCRDQCHTGTDNPYLCCKKCKNAYNKSNDFYGTSG